MLSQLKQNKQGGSYQKRYIHLFMSSDLHPIQRQAHGPVDSGPFGCGANVYASTFGIHKTGTTRGFTCNPKAFARFLVSPQVSYNMTPPNGWLSGGGLAANEFELPSRVQRHQPHPNWRILHVSALHRASKLPSDCSYQHLTALQLLRVQRADPRSAPKIPPCVANQLVGAKLGCVLFERTFLGVV